MTVRLKIALTIFVTGALTALGVIATVLFAFQRFEHETTYQRANAFLGRVVHACTTTCSTCTSASPRSSPPSCATWCCSSPTPSCTCSTPQGTVLASTRHAQLPPGFKVALAPVQQAASDRADALRDGRRPRAHGRRRGDRRRPLRRAVIRSDEPVAGYLYLVCPQRRLPAGRWQALRSSFARPALG